MAAISTERATDFRTETDSLTGRQKAYYAVWGRFRATADVDFSRFTAWQGLAAGIGKRHVRTQSCFLRIARVPRILEVSRVNGGRGGWLVDAPQRPRITAVRLHKKWRLLLVALRYEF